MNRLEFASNSVYGRNVLITDKSVLRVAPWCEENLFQSSPVNLGHNLLDNLSTFENFEQFEIFEIFEEKNIDLSRL